MRWIGGAALISVAIVGFAGNAWAVGTDAGTPISNTASAEYTIGGGPPITENSPPEVITVAEVLDVDVTLLTTTANPNNEVDVTPGDTDEVLTFSVTNTGNGTDTYSLAGLSTGFNGSGNDTFDPGNVRVFLDDGTTPGVFDASDTAYVPGVNDPTIIEDGSVTIHILNDIDDPAVVDTDLGDSQLTATSTSLTLFAPGAVAGDSVAALGDGGGDLVLGSSVGTDAEFGTYLVSLLGLDLVKSSTVLDQFGGSEAIPGATVTYTITVDVRGTGTVQAVVISDPIPAELLYVADSITLNGASQTDAADSPGTDDSTFIATGNGTVSVTLGDLPSTTATQTITFEATIR